jgi:pyruvate kinase
MRYTKIVVTLGPAVETPEAIGGLVEAGMDVARLNFSHGDHATHERVAGHVRRAAAKQGKTVAILQDIQGPKIRVGTFPGGSVRLERGSTVRLRPGTGEGDNGMIEVDYERLLDDLAVGAEVVLADGLVRLEITHRGTYELVAQVTQGGPVGDHQGAAFPHTDLRVLAVTAKDEDDLAFGRRLGVDFVAASFVRTAADVHKVRDLSGVPVIAKIERAAAVANLDEILSAADGVMVARGDLGVELPLERLPAVQMDILRRANAAGLISVTATEMLESMKHSARPTRAEVTDVATAVMEGTDAVMLSGETAIGDYPIETVSMMHRILEEADRPKTAHQQVRFLSGPSRFASATTRAAVEASVDLGLETIVAFTESGATARLLSKYRPEARIMAFSAVDDTVRRMALYRGVTPLGCERFESTDDMIEMADRYLVEGGLCPKGTGVVVVAGTPPNRSASTNLLKLHSLGSARPGRM